MWNFRFRKWSVVAIVVLLLTLLQPFLFINFVNNGGTPPQRIINSGCYQQFGVNLSGEEWDPVYNDSRPTVDELQYYSDKHVHLIRLPLRWDRLQPHLNGPLKVEEVSWLKSFIEQANSRHILVDVDIHLRSKDDDLNFGTKLPAIALADLWGKLAGVLKNVPGICGYDIANEPDHKVGRGDVWPIQANAVISAIRKVDSNHYILVNEDNWTSSAMWSASEADQLKDPMGMLVYEAHSYWDDDLSGNYTPDNPPESKDEAIKLSTNNFAPFVDWCGTSRRCFVGEFGVPPDIGWLWALDAALQDMKVHHIGGTYWAGGPQWGTYPLSIEPINGKDRPQMSVLEKYLVKSYD